MDLLIGESNKFIEHKKLTGNMLVMYSFYELRKLLQEALHEYPVLFS